MKTAHSWALPVTVAIILAVSWFVYDSMLDRAKSLHPVQMNDIEIK